MRAGFKRVAENDPSDARPSSPKRRNVRDDDDTDPTVGAPTPEEAKSLESLLVDRGVEFYDSTDVIYRPIEGAQRLAHITKLLTTSIRFAREMTLSEIPCLPRDTVSPRMHWLYAMLCARMIRNDSSLSTEEAICASILSASEALRGRRRDAEFLATWHSLSQLNYFGGREVQVHHLGSVLHWHYNTFPLGAQDATSFLLERLAEEDAHSAVPGTGLWVKEFLRYYEGVHHRGIDLVMERFAARVPLLVQAQLCLFRALKTALRRSESLASAPNQYFTCSVVPEPLELLAFRSGQQRESMLMDMLTATTPVSFPRDLARIVCAYLGGQQTRLPSFGRLDQIDPKERKKECEADGPLIISLLGGGREFDEEPLLWMSLVCCPDVSSLLGPNVPDEVFDQREFRRAVKRQGLRNECKADGEQAEEEAS